MTKSKPSYSEVKDLLDGCPSYLTNKNKKGHHKYKMFDLTRPANTCIKELLEEFGYWLFAPNRSKNLVSEHQVIAFLFVSPNKPMDGSAGEHVTHHLSGNTLDNRPSNLVYLTEEDHALVTRHQRKVCTFTIKSFYKVGGVLMGLRTSINKQGNKVKNWAKFIMGVIALTVAMTFDYSGYMYSSNNTPNKIKQVIAFAGRFIRKMLDKTVYLYQLINNGTVDEYCNVIG